MGTTATSQPENGRKRPTAGAEVHEALDLLLESEAVTELRALGTTRRTVSGYFTNFAVMANAAAGLSGEAEGIYFTLNPVNAALLARADNRVKPYAKYTTNDGDILCRRWLPLDFDSKRPAGISSTDDEHHLALERASKCREWLSLVGWPDPVMADSGNGAHLLYRVALPNDVDSSNLIRRVLEAIALRFSDATVEVDLKTFNAARIWKLYGTLAAKGDSTPERPHRIAQILSHPATLQTVTHQRLAALAIPEAPLQAPERNGQMLDVAEWLAKHEIEVAKQKPWNSGTCYVLRVCPNNSEHNRGEAFVLQFAHGGIVAKCQHVSCGFSWKSLREKYEANSHGVQLGKDFEKSESARPVRASLPEIIVTDRPMRDMTMDSLRALQEANEPPTMFVRLGSAVYVSVDERSRSTIEVIDPAYLRGKMSRAANYFAESKEGLTHRFPPAAVVNDILSLQAADLGFPPLESITEIPLLRPDGTLVSTVGYDPVIKVVYSPAPGLTVCGLPDEPTANDLKGAADLILELLGEFPFKDAASRANAVALLLTPCIRNAIQGQVPIALIDAPQPGTGKSLLARLVSEIATGGEAAMMNAPRAIKRCRFKGTPACDEPRPG